MDDLKRMKLDLNGLWRANIFLNKTIFTTHSKTCAALAKNMPFEWSGKSWIANKSKTKVGLAKWCPFAFWENKAAIIIIKIHTTKPIECSSSMIGYIE